MKTPTHGMSNWPEYQVWKGMRHRCNNPSQISYPIYGARGIKVCDRWNHRDGFRAFIADMGRMPGPKYEIDRIDNNGDYCPENCRWVTRSAQQRNTRQNRRLTHDGKTLCVVEWSELLGISQDLISQRLSRGYTDIEALTKPVNQKKLRTRGLVHGKGLSSRKTT